MNNLVTKKIFSNIPSQAVPIDFVRPLSYEFRVVETVEDGRVTKVGLQFQVWEHDEFGSGIVKQYWQDVPRVQMDKNGTLIINP